MGVRMKLGFWNRLAIVAGALFTVAAPSWLILSSNMEATRNREDGFSNCVSGVGKPGSDLTYEFCRQSWLGDPVSHLGWTHWLQAAAICACVALFFYGLIWVCVSVAKWVWRGRGTPA